MPNNKKYPFKYFDAYDREDKDFYFGRDEEVKQFYDMTFQTDLLLVYGASGAGKTSLIQCGLANCFESHNWLALTIRRGSDINQSLKKALNDEIGSDKEYFEKEWETDNDADNSSLARQIKTLRLKYFKPIYLIFDQFEELYILGNKKEQEDFYQAIKQLLALNQPVKIIISIREEYLGHLYYFERVIPDILRKKLRIESMTLDKVSKVMQGINNPDKSLVTLQKGEEEALIQAIFDKLRENKISIDLPYLQVLLEKVYLNLTDNDEQHNSEAILTLKSLEGIGTIGDILFSLLDGLVSQLKTNNNIITEIVWKTLSCFVTDEGTKEPLSIEKLHKQIPEITHDTLIEILQFFTDKRILRYNENEQVYEIAHDTLAKQIHDNRSADEKAQMQIKKMIREKINKSEKLRTYLAKKELEQVDLHLDKLQLTKEEEDFIKQSRKEIEKVKKKEIGQQRTIFFAFLTSFVFLIGAISLGVIINKKNEQSNNLRNALDFYNGKYALTYRDGYACFMNPNGEIIEELGRWENAEKFNIFGFAKVTDWEGTTYWLDIFGNKYENEDKCYKDVRYLNLSFKRLTELSPDIGKFTSLEVLDLSDNRLTSLPAEIGNLINLRMLDISGNRQLTSLPKEIENLNLIHFYYFGNNFDELSKRLREKTESDNDRIKDYYYNEYEKYYDKGIRHYDKYTTNKDIILGCIFLLAMVSIIFFAGGFILNLNNKKRYWFKWLCWIIGIIFSFIAIPAIMINFSNSSDIVWIGNIVLGFIFLHIVLVASINGISFFGNKKRNLLKWLCQFILGVIILLLFAFYEISLYFSFIGEGKEQVTLFVLFHLCIIFSIIGGIISRNKKYNLLKWICWGIAGVFILAILIEYIYLVKYFIDEIRADVFSLGIFGICLFIGMLAGIIGGFIFNRKQNHIYKWIGWGIAIECMIIIHVFSFSIIHS